MSIGTKAFFATAVAASIATGFHALSGSAPDDAAPNDGQVAARSSDVQPASAENDDAASPERTRWQRRVSAIRAQDPPVVPAAAGDSSSGRERDTELPPAIVSSIASLANFGFGCDDVGTDVNGALTVEIVLLGAPDIGTVVESVDVLGETFGNPEFVECMTESMIAFVGEAPSEPFEHRFTLTRQMVAKDADPEAKSDHARDFEFIVGAHLPEIRHCARVNDIPPGSVAADVSIGDDGKASEVVLKPANALSEEAATCIRAAIGRWAFSDDLAGRTFSYDFVFPIGG